MRIPRRGQKCEAVKAKKSAFAKASFRWVASGKGRILVGCPKGHWKPRAKRCAVGLRAYAVVTRRAKGAKCPAGYRRA